MDAAIASYNKKQQSNLELMQRMIDNNNVVDRWAGIIDPISIDFNFKTTHYRKLTFIACQAIKFKN